MKQSALRADSPPLACIYEFDIEQIGVHVGVLLGPGAPPITGREYVTGAANRPGKASDSGDPIEASIRTVPRCAQLPGGATVIALHDGGAGADYESAAIIRERAAE